MMTVCPWNSLKIEAEMRGNDEGDIPSIKIGSEPPAVLSAWAFLKAVNSSDWLNMSETGFSIIGSVYKESNDRIVCRLSGKVIKIKRIILKLF